MQKRTLAPLRALCRQEEKVYVYLAAPALCRRFLAQAQAEGFRFADGAAPTAKHCSDIIALNPDRTLNYVGFVGHAAFGGGAKQAGGRPLRRIDYRKLLAGGPDIEYRP